ncbi:MAG: pseudouridine synthase, partial [Myxococcaceae bacterium]
CGVVLPFMLEGLEVEPDPGEGAIRGPRDELRIVYEDEWLIVVDKPCGLPSASGRHARDKDSVRVRLQRRFNLESEPLIVDPLDAEASGLLIAAKDRKTLAVLQRQYSQRDAGKRYVAMLDGHVAGEHGTVELPVRGKRAVTEWRVTQRGEGRTRVVLVPRTSRLQQLALHTADPSGLNAVRVMLHADWLTFAHPRTNERLEFTSLAPF